MYKPKNMFGWGSSKKEKEVNEEIDSKYDVSFSSAQNQAVARGEQVTPSAAAAAPARQAPRQAPRSDYADQIQARREAIMRRQQSAIPAHMDDSEKIVISGGRRGGNRQVNREDMVLQKDAGSQFMERMAGQVGPAYLFAMAFGSVYGAV